MERPNIVINNNRRVYQSLDLVDEAFFNGLTTDRERENFCEIVYELRLRNQTVPNGEAIVERWDPIKRRVRKLRSMIPVADQASPPAGLVRTPTARSPAQSPLLELSPRLACQNDGHHALLSPTRGEVDAIADDLEAPWKFADVIFQRETLGRVPLAPPLSVYLLVRPDENGTIEEQLAVKSIETNEFGDFDGPGEEELQEQFLQISIDAAQREIDINRLVELTRCSHVARYRGHSVRESRCDIIEPEQGVLPRWKIPSKLDRRTVSIYQDFAGYGDLSALIDRHCEKKRPINEHFIWYTLRELTEAVIALHEGPGVCSKPHETAISSPTPNDLPSEPWLPIMHFDLKPKNVLLEVGNNGDYPEYPKPVLADFGISYQGTDAVIDLKKTDGPLDNAPRFFGTKGWLPPERYFVNDRAYYPLELSPLLSDKSDVWTLGLLAHAMIYAHQGEKLRLDTLSNVDKWEQDLTDLEDYRRESHFNTFSNKLADLPMVYGAQLCYTIERCLRHDVNARPSLRDLLEICQDKLTRMDKMPGSTAGKRKRDDDSEDDTRLATAGYFTQKFDRFGVGEIYRPKRVRMMANLPEPDDHGNYIDFVDEWSRMRKPTPESQIAIVDALDQYFLNVADEHSLINQGNADRWAMSHLVSCLRKRCEPKGAAYILTAAHFGESNGWAWIKKTFELEIKAKVMRRILDDHDFWVQAGSSRVEGVQVALAALQNAMSWGSIMLFNTEVPANETDNFQGPVAEPREPRMEEQSALHLGIYDWIFVLPRGALHFPQ